MYRGSISYLFKCQQKSYLISTYFHRGISNYVLSFNCGSSSVKCKVVDPESGLEAFACHVDKINTDRANVKIKQRGENDIETYIDEPSIEKACLLIKQHISPQLKLGAIGHRVVHGGAHFRRPVIIDENVKDKIREASAFAPLHNMASLAGIRGMSAAYPGVPQAAVFDTAFHSDMPKRAKQYAIPEAMREAGIVRYGFHGISHQCAFQEAANKHEMKVGRDYLKAATAHLGNGCSLAAVVGGRSVDTTMGMTPLEGLIMGTRAGQVDPAIFGVANELFGWGIQETLNVLNKQSGFLGVAGTSDSREVEKACLSGCPKAKLALEMFCYNVAKTVAAYQVAMGGLHVLVFTGGIGEKSAMKRRRILELLAPVGFAVDDDRNNNHGSDSDGFITTHDSSRTALVVKANEELIIARETFNLIKK